MYLLYSDEANLNPSDNAFFIYGGVVINCANAKSLSEGIQKVREEKHIPDDFVLKMNPGPESLSNKEFIEVKQGIIQKAIENQCVLLISLIHHRVASSPEEVRRNEINRVAFNFNCLLNRYHSHGLMLIDRFSDSQIDTHLRDKFSKGIIGFPYSEVFRLDRILGFHYSAIGQAHFGSLVDIVIGSIRFAINAFSKNYAEHLETARLILRMIGPLFYREEASENKVSELSLFFSPKIIRAPSYREEYEKLKCFFDENGIIAEQMITDQRFY